MAFSPSLLFAGATEEARLTCAIVDAAAKVRDPNRASEGAEKVFQKIYQKPI